MISFVQPLGRLGDYPYLVLGSAMKRSNKTGDMQSFQFIRVVQPLGRLGDRVLYIIENKFSGNVS